MPRDDQLILYISCVGEQDPVSPKTGEEGSLLTCYKYLCNVENITLNEAILIPTSKKSSPQRHTECQAKKCAQILRKEFKTKISVESLKVRNPANLKEVYPKMRALLSNIRWKIKQKHQNTKIVLHINTSSGTPQMKESLIFLVNTGFFESWETHLWQVFDPRGGYQDLKERVQRAPELDLLTQERILFRLEQLVIHHMYREANDWLKYPLEVKYLNVTRNIFSFLDDYNQWLYNSAKNKVNKLKENNQIPDFLLKWLKDVSEWLDALTNDPISEGKVAIDRYYCAERRLLNGFYPDVINHAWTSCELLLTLSAQGRITDPHKMFVKDLIEELRRFQDNPLNKQSIQLQGHSSQTLLDAIDWLRGIRNEVTHGSQPVDRSLAKKALKIAWASIEAMGLQNEANNCPLRPNTVQQLLSQLIQSMRESLWECGGELC